MSAMGGLWDGIKDSTNQIGAAFGLTEEEAKEEKAKETACEDAGDDDCELVGENEDELDGDIQEGDCVLEARGDGEKALQLDHELDPGKFHVGVKWVHLAYLTGKKEKYNGYKVMVVSFGVRDPAKVKVRTADKNADTGRYIALWVKRINCRNTVHKDTGAYKATANGENTGATGAARWVALGRSEVDKMQGKLKFQKTPEEEAYRDEMFPLADVNHNGMLSLAEVDKALPELFGCVALFNAKPAIIRGFLAATGRPPAEHDDAAFRKHQNDYVYPGEQFRLLFQYLHQYFELYLIFQDMGDSDADRRIDIKEWAQFITSGKADQIGIKVTPEMLEDKCGETLMPGYSLFNEIDVDQGGCILFKEFSDYAIRQGLQDPERCKPGASSSSGPVAVDFEKLKEIFHQAKDLENTMSLGKFHAVLTKLGFPPEDIEGIIRETDTNKNYAIDIDEFMDWLMKGSNCEAFQAASGE